MAARYVRAVGTALKVTRQQRTQQSVTSLRDDIVSLAPSGVHLPPSGVHLPPSGVHLAPARWLLAQSSQAPVSCPRPRPHAARCRLLHVSPAASRCSSRTEPQRNSRTEDQRSREEGEEEPEYIPRKGKNPMMKIGYAWMIGLPTGIISFVLAKREVDKNRLKQLKVRQRMRRSNDGEYEGSRYHRHKDADANPGQ
ncbi:DUF4748 domain-containing protein isoform X2 [Scophthalmus maximus]|uniref:Si:ch73-71c20.5 n=1 Tax=Scophthalmus maximus TaxID=52904 RepID=A0A8D3AMZ1_SCOMX|nr:DUF4748 domain-containing protein isoform X2 [Scophthalmus maximus]